LDLVRRLNEVAPSLEKQKLSELISSDHTICGLEDRHSIKLMIHSHLSARFSFYLKDPVRVLDPLHEWFLTEHV